MKAQILSLISMLAFCAFARPRARPFDDNDPIAQRSQVTAFVVTDEGVTVECWEISDLLPDSTPQYNQRHGLKGPSVIRMANDDLQGVDLLTWPEPQSLWPPPSDSMHSQWFDLSAFNNLFSINGGLINFNVNFRLGSRDDDDDDSYIFSAENGDNWFYFEDSSTGDYMQQCPNAKSAAPPLTISTRSATDTTLTQFKYKSTPTHKVLHSGRCKFTGLVNDASNNRRRLTTQEL